MQCLFIIIYNLETDSKIITSSIDLIRNLKPHFQIFSTNFSIFQKTFEIFCYKKIVQLNNYPTKKKHPQITTTPRLKITVLHNKFKAKFFI